MENVVDNVIDSTLTGGDPGTVETADGKTFSQEEVNSIIRDRLAKEKDKTQKQFEALQQELAQKELNFKAKELVTGKGLSLDILEVLKFDDEASLQNSIQILENIFKAVDPAAAAPGYGLTINSSGNHGGIQQPTVDSSIKKAMGLKS
ncbi:DUF4355 domain-containing protein [Acetobacterium sp.]|uniref:capsid assembly scaffolding protein Gp46 family protein n=1 Tax=Acetobacterium sp. TaxID=1872094 RepID=UPI0027253781|nr:DUF4355 domain-containing protein [Acetobacterium sp.]MDO9492489.1 DUF4355 domain-containing protein [Acetobacterium sp.]